MGMWFERDSPLWMLPCMSEDLVIFFQIGGISNIQLLDLPKINMQSRFGNSASNLQQDLQHFPRIQVKLRIQGKDVARDNTSSLSIQLEKCNRRRTTARAFTPRFPKLKYEAWYLVLGNTSTSKLHALKRISFKDHLVTRMKLPQTTTSFQGMKLLLISDCYLRFDQEYSIEELMES